MSAPDLHLARRMLYACICAYNVTGDKHGPVPVPGADRVVSTKDGYSYSVVNAYQAEVGFAAPPERYNPAFYADGDHDIDAALVGVTHDGFAVVALRGTLPPSLHGDDLMQWVDDWANDARIAPVPWTVGDAPYGKAESGFAKATGLLWTWIEGQLDAVLDQAPNGVLITGHSKGGAMCYLLAALVNARWPRIAGKIEVHAFAPAVSVDSDFVTAYDAAGLAARTTRYIVTHDVVPFLPKWTAADIWVATHLKGWRSEAAWFALGAYVAVETGGGYAAPGTLVYLEAGPKHTTAPDALDQALAQVVTALKNEDFKTIGAAHSVTDSYAVCFPPLVPGPAVMANRG